MVSGPNLPTPRGPGRGRAALSGRVAAALLLSVLAAGCGAGFDAASVSVRPNSGTAQNGFVKVNNVWVVMDPATRNAEVIGAVANIGGTADRLTSVTAGGLPATVLPAPPTSPALGPPVRGVTVQGDSVLYAAGAAASFGRPGGPELELRAVPFAPGRIARVVMDFQRGGTVAMNALVMANTGQFAEYDPNGPNPVSTPVIRASASAP